MRLHEFEDADGNVDWRAINNNRQKIFRWLRGETTAARRKTQVLASVMKAVLPAERRRVWSRRAIPFCWQRWRQKKGWKRLTLYISTSRQR
ncbi:toxin YdaT family protein [Staphylococcus sp. GCP4]|nr:toxin YdaT family protein [Staphylococcus sp. GCP4]